MNFSDALSFDIAEAIGRVAAARRAAEVGSDRDLHDLPARVEVICRLVRTLPDAETRRLKPLLDRLDRDLDEARCALEARPLRVQPDRIG